MQSIKFTNTKKLIWLFLLLLLTPLTSFTSAQDNNPNGDPLTEVGSWSFGRYTEVTIDEVRSLAFVSSGGNVIILDISNPASPVLVNDQISTNGVVNDLIYNSATQNLYITLGENGLEIWDVQNINSPQHLSSLLLNYFSTTPPATKMSAKPGFVFIAAEYAGIITVNVSNPASPFQSSFNLGFGGTKYTVDLSDDGSFLVASSTNSTELYVVNSDGSISLIDEGPSLVGAWEIHIIGTYSFQILQGTLYVLDLNSLGLPVVATYNLLGNATTTYNMSSFNDKLYISDPFYGVEIFDVVNPANPVLLGSYETNTNDLKYFNNYVVVADNSGMTIINVSDPANPIFVSNYQGVGSINTDVKVSGSYCYLSSNYSLNVLDVSDPTNPVLVGVNQPSSGFDIHMEKSGSYLFITNQLEGIRVVDISDPLNPVTIGTSNPTRYNHIAINGNYVYVNGNQNDFRVFDVSDPTSPTEVGSLIFPAPNDLTSAMRYSNGYVFVSQYSAGIKIIDVSDPTQPTQVASYSQNVDLTYLDVEGNHLYTPDIYPPFQSIVDVFDITDPLNPVIVGIATFGSPPPHAWFNFIFGDILLVGDFTNPYLTVVDVSNPSQPSRISTQVTADFVINVDADPNYFYVATREAGLHIYENPYGAVPVELTSFTANVSGNDVELQWQTATETNNNGFQIQRLQDSEIGKSQEWENIGFVEGHGTATEEHNYYFVDKNISIGLYQYRLKHIDFDGSFEYSKIVNVEISHPVEYSLEQNYPNPFNPSTTIKFSIPKAGIVNLKIFNTLGEEITSLVNGFKEAGNYVVNFNAMNLSSGIYYYRLSSNNFNEIKKMILLK